MDLVSERIFDLNIDLLTTVAKLFHNEIIFAIALILMIFIGTKSNNKRMKILTALSLALILGFALKFIYNIERPCTKINDKGITCLSSSFPSLHTITVFTLAAAFVRKDRYLVYLLFALFVAFTRIYLGAHRFEEIAASAALAPLIYHIVDLWWKDENK